MKIAWTILLAAGIPQTVAAVEEIQLYTRDISRADLHISRPGAN